MSQSVKKEMMSFAEKESSALAITAASGKLGHAIAKKTYRAGYFPKHQTDSTQPQQTAF